MVRLRMLLAAVMLVIGTLGLVGCGESGYWETHEGWLVRTDIAIEHHYGVDGAGGYHVLGTAINTTNRTLTYSEIRARFYDGKGNLIGESNDNILHFKAGEAWQFDVLLEGKYIISYVDHYEILAVAEPKDLWEYGS